jgi:hypothetical protein
MSGPRKGAGASSLHALFVCDFFERLSLLPRLRLSSINFSSYLLIYKAIP